jgi:hypothetical protein
MKELLKKIETSQEVEIYGEDFKKTFQMKYDYDKSEVMDIIKNHFESIAAIYIDGVKAV